MPDYSTWLTKSAAADAIGVSTKTIEKLAADRKIQQASWRRPTGGPPVAVFHPDDVARIAAERQPGVTAFVLPAVPTNGNGHRSDQLVSGPTQVGSQALALPAGDDPIRQLFAAALRAVTSQSSQKSAPLWVTVAEASAITGLTQAFLRRRIDDGALSAIRDRGWKIRRKDLEAL